MQHNQPTVKFIYLCEYGSFWKKSYRYETVTIEQVCRRDKGHLRRLEQTCRAQLEADHLWADRVTLIEARWLGAVRDAALDAALMVMNGQVECPF